MVHSGQPDGHHALAAAAAQLRRTREVVAGFFTAGLDETKAAADGVWATLGRVNQTAAERAGQGFGAVLKALREAWAAVDEPLASVSDLLDLRGRLFTPGSVEARCAWGNELMELTTLGYGAQADRQLEGVLGLPHYRYHDAPRDSRPHAPFAEMSPVLPERPDISTPEPSRLAYLTPVARALDLTPDDVLYDLGSGLGKAGLFFGACTPVGSVVGYEIEPEYARFADARARELGLSHVSFVNADALEVDLAGGTAFYFYNPFVSTEERDALGMLADRLAELGARQPIQVAVKGPKMQTLLRDSGVFSAETVLEDPAVWIVFRSHDAR